MQPQKSEMNLIDEKRNAWDVWLRIGEMRRHNLQAWGLVLRRHNVIVREGKVKGYIGERHGVSGHCDSVFISGDVDCGYWCSLSNMEGVKVAKANKDMELAGLKEMVCMRLDEDDGFDRDKVCVKE
ncbi:hypothetical protein VNO78_22124 [Psophocarpus tetragonolobus]|uniref:Uncharacterized protein n=1 Tax=Psophocarpus tetragonolobus TaxID=3891 RepID=A0AAN9SCR8_PSOTE